MTSLLRRLPGRAQIIPVYGVIAIILYTWTLLWFFWKLPSWLYFLNAAEIAASLAYLLVTNLAESLLVLGAALLLALVLPRRWFRDVFVARGSALVIAGLGAMILLAEQFNNFTDYPTLSLPLWQVLLALLCIALAVYASGRVHLLRRTLEAVADRASIFTFVLVPLSAIAVVVVLARVLV